MEAPEDIKQQRQGRRSRSGTRRQHQSGNTGGSTAQTDGRSIDETIPTLNRLCRELDKNRPRHGAPLSPQTIHKVLMSPLPPIVLDISIWASACVGGGCICTADVNWIPRLPANLLVVEVGNVRSTGGAGSSYYQYYGFLTMSCCYRLRRF